MLVIMDIHESYDVVVIGGGAAGLSAALVLGRSRRSVLVIDAGEPRNAPATHMHNYLGREGAKPTELLEIGREEVGQYGVEVRRGRATSAARTGAGFAIGLEEGSSVSSRRLVLATGVVDVLPEVPGLRERFGRDVLHCPYCHGWEVADLPLGIVATGTDCVERALLFRQWSDDVVILLNGQPAPQGEDAGRSSPPVASRWRWARSSGSSSRTTPSRASSWSAARWWPGQRWWSPPWRPPTPR